MVLHLKPIWKRQQFSTSEGRFDGISELGERKIRHLRDTQTYRNFGSCLALRAAVFLSSDTNCLFFSPFPFFSARGTTRVERKLIFAPQRRVDSAFTGVTRKHLECRRSRYHVHCLEEEGHIWVASWIASMWHDNGYCGCTATTHERRKWIIQWTHQCGTKFPWFMRRIVCSAIQSICIL